MHKICVLIPCLMKPNNEEVNMKRMRELHDELGFDDIIIYDQCFEDRHKEPWMTLIGHAKEPQGFVKPRNELLKWFYESDFDYAMWMDANAVVSRPQRNALMTLKAWLESGECPYDVVQSTFQLWVSGEGILDHRRPDYDKTILVSTLDEPVKVRDGTMIGMVMANFSKKYGDKPYIRHDCDPWSGTSEDVFFINLIKRLYRVGLCSSLGFSKSGSKTSTWREGQGTKYNYPPIKKEVLDQMIREYVRESHLVVRKEFMAKNTFEIERVARFKDLIKEFKPKNKKIISRGLLK